MAKIHVRTEVIFIPCLFPKYALKPESSFMQEKEKRIQFISKDIYENILSGATPYLVDPTTGEIHVVPVKIDCGTCVECKRKKATHWAIRMACEASLYPDVGLYNDDLVSGSCNWFVTLTYDETYVPHSEKNWDLLTTHLDHVSEFVKRLRRHWDYHYPDEPPIRVYFCSEYGDKTWRPHYHMILFNFKLFDAKHKFDNFQGDRFYTSETLQDLWKFGYVVSSPMNFQTALYTARYTNKKLYGDNAVDCYDSNGLERMNTRMSRMPGIGFPYYEQNKDKIFSTGSIMLPNGKQYFPPPAFVKKYLDSVDYQEALRWYKVKAKFVEGLENKLLNELRRTSLPEEEYFKKKVEARQKIVNQFPREKFNENL